MKIATPIEKKGKRRKKGKLQHDSELLNSDVEFRIINSDELEEEKPLMKLNNDAKPYPKVPLQNRQPHQSAPKPKTEPSIIPKVKIKCQFVKF